MHVSPNKTHIVRFPGISHCMKHAYIDVLLRHTVFVDYNLDVYGFL